MMMMEQEDEGSQPSGLLSPRRIEAIDTAFNKFFENARKEGTIRDPSTYGSFDHVYEIAMKRRNAVDVEEESRQERGWSMSWDDDPFGNEDDEGEKGRGSSEVERLERVEQNEQNVQVVAHDQENEVVCSKCGQEYRFFGQSVLRFGSNSDEK